MANALLAAVLLVSIGATFAAGGGSGIYPADHWSYSTKLTSSNYEAAVKEAVDSGKTMFMRIIASEG
jgi:hypothetical protein